MKEEQLNEASKSAINGLGDYTQVNAACLQDAFKQGARWHESLPLAERLTEEEKAKIRNYHRVLSKDKHIAIYQRSYSGLASTDALLFSLEQIFGKELFTKSE